VDRASFPDDDFDEIKPRDVTPIEPRLEPIPASIIVPEASIPAPDPAAEIAQIAIIAQEKAHAPVIRVGVHSAKDGPTQSDVLLQAIVITARREQTPTTRAALRNLIAKFSHAYGLDF